MPLQPNGLEYLGQAWEKKQNQPISARTAFFCLENGCSKSAAMALATSATCLKWQTLGGRLVDVVPPPHQLQLLCPRAKRRHLVNFFGAFEGADPCPH